MYLMNLNRHETIRIGDAVRLVVLKVKRDRVRLGVAAPRHVAVHRGEVHAKVLALSAAAVEAAAARRAANP